MTQSLKIDVTLNQVGSSLNATYTKDTTSSATSATVDIAGNIDLSSVTDEVSITWALDGVSTKQFMPIPANPNGTNGPFRWGQKNPGNPGQELGQQWTVKSLSTDNRSLTVADKNEASTKGTPWNYSLWLTGGVRLDPSIINR
jgi:hypothetical protein